MGEASAPGAVVTLLGTGVKLEWEAAGSGFVARVPRGTRPPSDDAWVFRISAALREESGPGEGR